MEGIFYDGQIFDAYVQIVNLIKQAKRSVILIDNYIDETTLTMLSKRSSGVTATIYTRQLNQQQLLDLQRHNQQYPPIDIHTTQCNHDRFLIIDDVVYLFGAVSRPMHRRLCLLVGLDAHPCQMVDRHGDDGDDLQCVAAQQLLELGVVQHVAVEVGMVNLQCTA